MACETRKDENGQVAMILCGRSRRETCKFCRRRPVTKLCDYPIGNGNTCDAGMCSECAINVAREVDYCPIHNGKVTA